VRTVNAVHHQKFGSRTQTLPSSPAHIFLPPKIYPLQGSNLTTLSSILSDRFCLSIPKCYDATTIVPPSASDALARALNHSPNTSLDSHGARKQTDKRSSRHAPEWAGLFRTRRKSRGQTAALLARIVQGERPERGGEETAAHFDAQTQHRGRRTRTCRWIQPATTFWLDQPEPRSFQRNDVAGITNTSPKVFHHPRTSPTTDYHDGCL
jgi:hypothetical protein